MAAQELRWLTYLLTDLGEAPRSPPFLYVDNKAMLALCQEHRLEHRTKHIALRYFLARELQQRGQLRLAYVASQANTTDVFTKALQPCDHQPCFAFLTGLLTPLSGLPHFCSARSQANVMAIQEGLEADDEDDHCETVLEDARTGLDLLLRSLACDKGPRSPLVAKSTPDNPPPVDLSETDSIDAMPLEPTVGSAPHSNTVTPTPKDVARNIRLKQATLSFGKSSATTDGDNNRAGPSNLEKLRWKLNLAQLIDDVYEDAYKNVCAAQAGDAGKCGRRGKGATDVQTQAFRKHAGTQNNKLAMAKYTALVDGGSRQPCVNQHRAACDEDKLRVVALLDSLLFVSKCDTPMGLWVKLVRYLAKKGVKGFPKKGYGTYYTTYGFGELTRATATWLQTTQIAQVLASPFVGISVDESTDHCSGKHLILYVTFIQDDNVVTEFMALLTVEKADVASLLSLLLSHVQAFGIDLRRITGISTDGANVMMGCKSGLVTRLRLHIPHLVTTHCIAHREALAAKDASDDIPDFNIVDKVIRNVAEHLGRSGPWHQRFLEELDYASLHALIKRTTFHIESRYVDCGDNFGGGMSERLSPFLTQHGPGGMREMTVAGIDSDGRPTELLFVLHGDPMEEFSGRGTHDGCVDVCTAFTEMIVSNIHGRLGDLESLSGSRLFTPDAWPLDRGERHARCVEWLESLIMLFKAEMNDDILPSINKRRTVKELRMFTSVLASAHKTERSFHAGLTAMLKTPDWRDNYPNLVQLWVAVAVLPLSTVECERGFSRQNIIKSWQRGSLKDARPGDLMCMSLMSYEPNWDEIVDIWRSYKKRKPHSNAPIFAGQQQSRKGKEQSADVEMVDLDDMFDASDDDASDDDADDETT
ncbi:unnamed protein product [Closterium sp. NIES-53]